MMRALSTTVSSFSTEMFLWLSTAMRESADIGSPCVPDASTTTLFGAACMMSCGQIENLLQPGNGRTEARDDQAPLGAMEDVFQPRPHRALAFRVARPVNVG